MTSNFHSPLTPFPLELKEDQHHQLFFLNSQSSASSSSSPAPCPRFFYPAQEQAGGYYRKESYFSDHQEDQAKISVSQDGSWDHQTVMNESDSGLKFSIWKKEERNENQSETNSVKWMSSKMRLMKKMMNSDGADVPNKCMQKFEDQKQPSSPLENDHNSCNSSYSNNSCSNNNNNNGDNITIRVCADCNTTKTPLWRSGPRGPKSLCNACGIRQRKARRAMAAAAAANGTIIAAEATSKKTKVQHKEKTSASNSSLPFKKRCKFASPSRGKKKLCFEDLTIILSKNSAFQRVFPQDEKEAAILLMALSYGLVHG